jgi:hypothetical protein
MKELAERAKHYAKSAGAPSTLGAYKSDWLDFENWCYVHKLASLPASPELPKTKLAQHVDSIRLLPQPDGTYLAEGEWDLLRNRGPVMVAGAGFEPATFGL